MRRPQYHNLKVNMSKYGFPEAEKLGAYQRVNGRITDLMNSVPHCRLKILWRSFWSTCGEPMRMAWTSSPQATGGAGAQFPKGPWVPEPAGRLSVDR